jgi:hypothetical protein
MHVLQALPSSGCCLQSHHLAVGPYTIVLSSHLWLDLSRGLFISGFLTRILYTFLIIPMCSICPAHLILLKVSAIYVLLTLYTPRADQIGNVYCRQLCVNHLVKHFGQKLHQQLYTDM